MNYCTHKHVFELMPIERQEENSIGDLHYLYAVFEMLWVSKAVSSKTSLRPLWTVEHGKSARVTLE